MDNDDLDWLAETVREIKIENGLAPDARGVVCLKCRKVLDVNPYGGLYCDCFEEFCGPFTEDLLYPDWADEVRDDLEAKSLPRTE